MRRAAGEQPVQARNALGRLPAGQSLSRRGAEEARPVDARDARCDQARGGLDPGHRRDPGTVARDLPNRMGTSDARTHRHGRRARRVHRPIRVAQSLHGEPQHRCAVVDVHARVEAGHQDDVLPALAPGDQDREDNGRPCARDPCGSHRLLPRKPRELRGLPVSASRQMLLDPGFELTLRPMRYPHFYEMYRNAVRNTWTVEEVDFSLDLNDLQHKFGPAERHLVERLVAFFATGDSIVANNLVLNLYQHINAPEARMFLSRQLYEEALHVQFYLTLLDTYLPDPAARARAFAAVDNIPSIRAKAAFCFKWMDSIQSLRQLETREQRRAFLLNLICFACCIEGLFFFAAFAYVWFLRSRGLLPGLASGTNWVFRDESGHMAFALEVIHTVRSEDPGLFDAGMERDVRAMLREAIEVEAGFADDVLSGGVNGLSPREMRQYLEYVADLRLSALGLAPEFGAKNPFPFMDLQDVQELTNFFERRVSAYQVGISGAVGFDDAF